MSWYNFQVTAETYSTTIDVSPIISTLEEVGETGFNMLTGSPKFKLPHKEYVIGCCPNYGDIINLFSNSDSG